MEKLSAALTKIFRKNIFVTKKTEKIWNKIEQIVSASQENSFWCWFDLLKRTGDSKKVNKIRIKIFVKNSKKCFKKIFEKNFN